MLFHCRQARWGLAGGGDRILEDEHFLELHIGLIEGDSFWKMCAAGNWPHANSWSLQMQNPKLKGFDGVEPCGTAQLGLTSWRGSRVGSRADVLEAGGCQASSSCAPAAGVPLHMGQLPQGCLPARHWLLQPVVEQEDLSRSHCLYQNSVNHEDSGGFVVQGSCSGAKVQTEAVLKLSYLFLAMPKWKLYGGHNVLKSIPRQMHAVAYIHLFWKQEGILLAHL